MRVPANFPALYWPVLMPSECLCLRFENDYDGTGRLVARAEAGGFAGHGGAYFSVSQIEEFAAAIGAFPLTSAERPSISGGFGKRSAPTELEQEHLGIEVYPIDARGHVGILVRLMQELWPGTRPESQNAVRLEIVTSYQSLAEFSRKLAALVYGHITEAVLVGDDLPS